MDRTDAVIDGRDRMQNDGHQEPPFVSVMEHYLPFRWPVGVSGRGAIEHPNYRYRAMGESE